MGGLSLWGWGYKACVACVFPGNLASTSVVTNVVDWIPEAERGGILREKSLLVWRNGHFLDYSYSKHLN